jgi:hypothetical protein
MLTVFALFCLSGLVCATPRTLYAIHYTNLLIYNFTRHQAVSIMILIFAMLYFLTVLRSRIICMLGWGYDFYADLAPAPTHCKPIF